MSIKNLKLRASALALFATVAVIAAEPAIAAPAKAPGITHTSTEFSAARRHHQAQRNTTTVRNAYGAYVGGPTDNYVTRPVYGYGVGDNSRNQTW